MDKKLLRQIKWQQRRVFPIALKLNYDQKILEQLKPLLKEYQSISTYLSIKDEIDTRLLIEHLENEEKTISIPKTKGQKMTMNLYTSDLVTTHFGLLEPNHDIVIEPELVIVPLLTFNLKGYRIGYGGGFYDRYLKDTKAKKIGLAYSWMLEDFEEDSHDVPLDIIVTEKESHIFT